jgi:hypothetical protein
MGTGRNSPGFAFLLLLSVVMVIVGSSPASAHPNRMIQGSDYADINGSHTSGYVCDNENDANLTYVEFFYSPPTQGGRAWDRGGADRVCQPFTLSGRTPVRWRMCEEQPTGPDVCTPTKEI